MRKRSRTLSSARAGRRPGAGTASSIHDDTAALGSSSNKATDNSSSSSSSSIHNANLNNINNSQQPAPDSHATEGICRHCGTNIGRFYNLFHKVSGTYYLPALLGSWDSKLRPTAGKQPKTAAPDSELDGCLLQSQTCSGCGYRLGFHVLEAPDSKSAFRGREFFKLSQIDLVYSIAGTKQVVEPRIDPSPPGDSQSTEERNSQSPITTAPPTATTTSTPAPVETDATETGPTEMETEPRPMEAPHEHHNHRHYHHHQPLKQVEPNRQPVPAPGRSPGALPSHAAPQKSPSHMSHPSQQNHSMPSPSPVPRPSHEPHFAQPPSRDRTASLANGARESTLTPTSEQQRSIAPNGAYAPRSPPEGHLDHITRLQTQISQNSGVLGLQHREMQALQRDMQAFTETAGHVDHMLKQQAADIVRVEQTVGRLQYDLHGFVDSLKALQHEVHLLRSAPPGAPASTAQQDAALELMAAQITSAAQKATEIDNLRVAVELIKRRIARLEGTEKQEPPPQASQTMPSYHTASPNMQHINSQPQHPPHRTASLPSHNSLPPIATEESEAGTPVQTQGGWVAVNSGVKRQSDVHEADPIKRPKLAPIEPRAAYPSSQSPHQQHSYSHMPGEEQDPRVQAQTHSHSLPHHAGPTHPLSHERMAASLPPSAHVSPHMQHTAYPPYPTQATPDHDAWRTEGPRVVETRTPRGRPRGGGGPGSRGGRGRKSTAHTITVSTESPDWSREGHWQGVPDAEASPSGYYHVAKHGIVRRGSGGGGPSRNGSRAVSLGMQGVTPGVGVGMGVGGMPTDPYAHTKKTRTKPTRNADGVLIRKDGRPDMRSQSSAANLRKVHARKEEQQSLSSSKERDYTPTSLGHSTGMGYETPSPTSSMPGGLTNTLQKKHSTVMKKMFPGGVDESRREVDYARQAFDEDKDQNHIAHPRNQHGHHESSKQHTAERHDSTAVATNANGRTPERAQRQHVDTHGDVAMEDAEQTEDEGRATREQTDHSAPYPDSASHEEPAPSVQQQQQQQQDKMSSTWTDPRPSETATTPAPALGLKAKEHVEPAPTTTTEVKMQEPDSS